MRQEQDIKSVSLSVIDESIEDDLDNDTLDKASSLDKDLEYEESPRTKTHTASVQTSAHVSVIDKSRLREKSVQTAKHEHERASQTMVEEVPQIKAEGNKDPCEIDWDDVSCDDEATQIQAGYRGMVARERMEAEEREIKKEIADRGQAIEDHLGINLSDPEVIAATTKIQAGFRKGD